MVYFLSHALSFLKRVKCKIISVQEILLKYIFLKFSIIYRKSKKFYQKYKNEFLNLKFQNIYEMHLKSNIFTELIFRGSVDNSKAVF